MEDLFRRLVALLSQFDCGKALDARSSDEEADEGSKNRVATGEITTAGPSASSHHSTPCPPICIAPVDCGLRHLRAGTVPELRHLVIPQALHGVTSVNSSYESTRSDPHRRDLASSVRLAW